MSQFDNELVQLRAGLRLGSVLAAGVVLAGLARFPPLEGAPLWYVFIASLMAAFIGGLGYAASQLARVRSPAIGLGIRRGTTLGLALSGLWAIYILGTHLLLPDDDKPTLGSTLTLATFAVTAAAVALTAAYSAWQTRSFRAGLVLGVWEGAVVGVLSCVSVLLMLYLFIGTLAQHMNSGELEAFAQSGWHNRETWFFWEEEFTGAALYVLVGLVWGVLASSLGGLLGKALGLLRRPA